VKAGKVNFIITKTRYTSTKIHITTQSWKALSIIVPVLKLFFTI